VSPVHKKLKLAVPNFLCEVGRSRIAVGKARDLEVVILMCFRTAVGLWGLRLRDNSNA
jgi:hypothetical protein